MAFDTPQPPLSDYLDWARSGRLQLPDFQREWTWEDERVRSLLVTVLRGHPLGAVMLLETGSDAVRFKPKPIAGVELATKVDPQYLLLDGQQRLTSLTQALSGDGVVQTKDAKGEFIKRRYYVDLRRAIEGDESIDESVFATPEDGVSRENFGRDIVRDLSTRELELEQEKFPIRLLLDLAEASTWLFDLADGALAKEVLSKVVSPVTKYQIPAIELKKDTSKAAVATVFEKVNTGGVPLTVFELLTAMYAGDAAYFEAHGDDFRLNDDWKAIQHTFASDPALRSIGSTDFLSGVTLLATRQRQLEFLPRKAGERATAISAKRDDILRLELQEYLKWRDALVSAFQWAATFVADQHIFTAKDLPYATQLIPVAVLRVILGAQADAHGIKAKLRQWFWCGILGELYGSSTETRFARDVEQVPGWATGQTDIEPGTVYDSNFAERRLYTLRTRNSAAYKGIYALTIGQGAKDWIKDVSFDKVQYAALSTDIHHIFPEKWSKTAGLDSVYWNSIVNKTPLAYETNRSIGGVAPSRYIEKVEQKAQLGSGDVDEILATHGIDPLALRTDDFFGHFEHRKEYLISLIEGAMGKRVQRETSAIDAAEVEAAYEPEDEFDEADDSSA